MSVFFEDFAALPNRWGERTRLHKLNSILFITIAAVLSDVALLLVLSERMLKLTSIKSIYSITGNNQ